MGQGPSYHFDYDYAKENEYFLTTLSFADKASEGFISFWEF
jgi:hypothetical protein